MVRVSFLLLLTIATIVYALIPSGRLPHFNRFGDHGKNIKGKRKPRTSNEELLRTTKIAFSSFEDSAHDFIMKVDRGDYASAARLLLHPSLVSSSSLSSIPRGRYILSNILRDWYSDLRDNWPHNTNDSPSTVFRTLIEDGIDVASACPIISALSNRNYRALTSLLLALNETNLTEETMESMINADGTFSMMSVDPNSLEGFLADSPSHVPNLDPSDHFTSPLASMFTSPEQIFEDKKDLYLNENVARTVRMCLESGFANALIAAATSNAPAFARLFFRAGQAGSRTGLSMEKQQQLASEAGLILRDGTWPTVFKQDIEDMTPPRGLQLLSRILTEQTMHSRAKRMKKSGTNSGNMFSQMPLEESRGAVEDTEESAEVLFNLASQIDPLSGLSAVHLACKEGRTAVLQLLAGVWSPNTMQEALLERGMRGRTCAHQAAIMGHTETLRFISELRDSKPFVPGEARFDQQREAASPGLEVLAALDDDGNSPCALALRHGVLHAPTIRLLNGLGACNDVKRRNRWDSIDIDEAASRCPPGEAAVGRPLSFNALAHVRGGWRMLSPAQLRSLGLPDDLLLRYLHEHNLTQSDSHYPSSNHEDEGLQHWFKNACGALELPFDILEESNEDFLRKELIDNARPFVVRGAYDPLTLQPRVKPTNVNGDSRSQPFHRSPASHDNENRNAEHHDKFNGCGPRCSMGMPSSSIRSRAELLDLLGDLQVTVAALPYGSAYGHQGGMMEVQDYVLQHMGHRGCLGFEKTQHADEQLEEQAQGSSYRAKNDRVSQHIRELIDRIGIPSEAVRSEEPSFHTVQKQSGNGRNVEYIEQAYENCFSKHKHGTHNGNNHWLDTEPYKSIDRALRMSNFVDNDYQGYEDAIELIANRMAFEGPGDHFVPPPYIFDGGILEAQGAARTTNFTIPRIFEKDNAHKQFAMGPPMSGAMMHFHGSAVNVVMMGVKLWVLTPPMDASFVDSAAIEWWKQYYLPTHGEMSNTVPVSPRSLPVGKKEHSGGLGNHHIIVLQGPGDLVMVPHGWGHAILNLADSMAFAFE